MKRYIYLVLALLFSLSLLTGCSNPISIYNVSSSPENSSSNTALNNLNESRINPYSQGVKLSQEYLTLEQIAKLVFENQMQYVEGANYPDESRIKDYKISTIRIEKIHDEGFIFSVDYSILPATKKFVLAGNGSIGDNGWINDKFHFVDVINVSGTYKIVSMATGRG